MQHLNNDYSFRSLTGHILSVNSFSFLFYRRSLTRSDSKSPDEPTQKGAWTQEISILKNVLENHEGRIFFEYSIPRMGRRIDVVLIIRNVIFVLEFKVGEKDFNQSAFDHVWDYALDLKNFHETSHINLIAPVLICTESKKWYDIISEMPHNDNLLLPIKTNKQNLSTVINAVLEFAEGENINLDTRASGRYAPTPTNHRGSDVVVRRPSNRKHKIGI